MYLAKCYKLNSEIVNLLNFKILVPVCVSSQKLAHN